MPSHTTLPLQSVPQTNGTAVPEPAYKSSSPHLGSGGGGSGGGTIQSPELRYFPGEPDRHNGGGGSLTIAGGSGREGGVRQG